MTRRRTPRPLLGNLNERRDVEQVMVVQGAGGVCKTVLAIRAARDASVQERYRDGVFWIDVARGEGRDTRAAGGADARTF
ncbi:MAG TPA: hypothetical protein ENN19_18865 [Chloroflexi bacterium]|nr:hypothetical protein [Chloroflexota bacterium]